MSRVKNISGGPLDVPLLARTVADGEIADVPDFQGDGVSPVVWPPDKWEPVTLTVKPEKAVKADTAKTAKADTGKAAG